MIRIKNTVLILVWAFLLLAVKDCDKPDELTICNPGESQSCLCGQAEWGIQYCNANGDAWGHCKCGDGLQTSAHPLDDAIPPLSSAHSSQH